MTVGQARILAIIVSMAYVPAHQYGFSVVWLPVMAACISWLLRLQLENAQQVVSRQQDAPQRAKSAKRFMYGFLFADAAISSAGLLLASLLSHSAPNESHFLARIFNAPCCSLLPSESIALDTFLFSVLLSVFLLFVCGSTLRRLMAQIHFKKSVDETDEDDKFAIYLYYKTRLAIEFPTLALLHILCIISLHHFLAPEFTYGTLDLIPSVTLPPLLYLETSLFLARAAVYFKNF